MDLSCRHGLLLLALSLATIPCLVVAQTVLLAGSGASRSEDGVGTSASFNAPSSVTFDLNDGSIAYVTDRTMIRQISVPTKQVSTLAGTSSACKITDACPDGVGSQAQFNDLAVMVLSQQQNISYLIDNTRSVFKIRVLDLATRNVSTLLLNCTDEYIIPFHRAFALAIANDGSDLFVAEQTRIFRINIALGNVTLLAGSYERYYDGIGINAYFADILGMTLVSQQTADGVSTRLMVSDFMLGGSMPVNAIRSLDPDTTTTETVSGGKGRGYADGVGTNALFDQPSGLCMSVADGLLVIFDYGNQKIRALNVTTYAVKTISTLGQSLPAVSVSRSPKGDDVDVSSDGLSILMTNRLTNKIYVLQCPTDDCPAGTYRSACNVISPFANNGQCVACPAHATSSTGSSSITDCACAVGYYGTYDICQKCPEGTYKAVRYSVYQNVSDCVPCPDPALASYAGSVNVSNCTNCAKGYNRSRNNNTCLQCPPNTYKFTVGEANCSSCPNGSTAVSGSAVCTCTDTATTMDLVSMACVCRAGYHMSSNRSNATCVACQAGQYKSSIGSTGGCSACWTHSYSQAGQPTCTCNAAYQPPSGSSSSCAACAAGTYKSAIGNVACESCASQPSCVGAVNPCYTASPGLFGGAFPLTCTRMVDSQCLRCPSPQLQAISGQTGLLSCSCKPGFYTTNLSQVLQAWNTQTLLQDNNQTQLCSVLQSAASNLSGKVYCMACPRGTYKSEVGPGPCRSCFPNSSSSLNSTNISACLCNAGYYQEVPLHSPPSPPPCPSLTGSTQTGSAQTLRCFHHQTGVTGGYPVRACAQTRSAPGYPVCAPRPGPPPVRPIAVFRQEVHLSPSLFVSRGAPLAQSRRRFLSRRVSAASKRRGPGRQAAHDPCAPLIRTRTGQLSQGSPANLAPPLHPKITGQLTPLSQARAPSRGRPPPFSRTRRASSSARRPSFAD